MKFRNSAGVVSAINRTPASMAKRKILYASLLYALPLQMPSIWRDFRCATICSMPYALCPMPYAIPF